jgi:hypothetical protein
MLGRSFLLQLIVQSHLSIESKHLFSLFFNQIARHQT